jgi:hypothetical protein
VVSFTGTISYLVRWKSYGPEFDEWKPASAMADAKDIVEEYERRMAPAASPHYSATLINATPAPAKRGRGRPRKAIEGWYVGTLFYRLQYRTPYAASGRCSIRLWQNSRMVHLVATLPSTVYKYQPPQAPLYQSHYIIHIICDVKNCERWPGQIIAISRRPS